jgi:hypothetical protein
VGIELPGHIDINQIQWFRVDAKGGGVKLAGNQA